MGWPDAYHSVLMVQAGTATSVRTRAERNAFNLITIDGRLASVTVHTWDGVAFQAETSVRYARVGHEWEPLSVDAARELEESEGAGPGR